MCSSSKINFVVALDAEAQPLIHHFKLKRVHSIFPFPVYKNSLIQLIVCGMGKHNAATATGYLAGSTQSVIQAWVNFGIAGGDTGNLGDIFLANSVVDQETGRRYYPSVCFDIDIQQAQVVTVNAPNTNYQGNVIYDQEAAGFFSAVSHFSVLEMTHSCKIISDNSDHGVDAISKDSVQALVKSRVNEVEQLVQVLLEFIDSILPDPEAAQAVALLIEKYHFTSSQQNTLKMLLQNWTALNGGKGLDEIQHIDARNSRQYLEVLSNMVASKQIIY